MKYLFDTNVVSALMSPTDLARGFRARVSKHSHEIAIASVTWCELVRGAASLADGRKKRDLREALWAVRDRFPILAYGEKAAEWHGEEQARLARKGKTPPFADGQIAAVACTNDLTLVTANVRDFRNFAGLALDNWIA